MKISKLLSLALIVNVAACELNVNNSGDIGTGGSKSDRGANFESGPCALWDIVGEYDGGVTFDAECVLDTGEDKFVIDDVNFYDPDFRSSQVIYGTWHSDQEYDNCSIQILDEEIVINCEQWSYRGVRK